MIFHKEQKKAMDLAIRAHRELGQTRWDGSDCVLVAAELHDVVEDTDVTLDDLADAGFPYLVIALVETLTKCKGESYFDFIMRIHDSGSICVAARAIKIADITCNMADANAKEKMSARYAKYELARYILRQGLN